MAESRRHVRASSVASCMPHVRASRARPPAAANRPTDTSGRPNWAVGEAMTMSLDSRKKGKK